MLTEQKGCPDWRRGRGKIVTTKAHPGKGPRTRHEHFYHDGDVSDVRVAPGGPYLTQSLIELKTNGGASVSFVRAHYSVGG